MLLAPVVRGALCLGSLPMQVPSCDSLLGLGNKGKGSPVLMVGSRRRSQQSESLLCGQRGRTGSGWDKKERLGFIVPLWPAGHGRAIPEAVLTEDVEAVPFV